MLIGKLGKSQGTITHSHTLFRQTCFVEHQLFFDKFYVSAIFIAMCYFIYIQFFHVVLLYCVHMSILKWFLWSLWIDNRHHSKPIILWIELGISKKYFELNSGQLWPTWKKIFRVNCQIKYHLHSNIFNFLYIPIG